MPFSALATALAKPAAFLGFFSQVDFATCSVFLHFLSLSPTSQRFFLTNVDMPKGSKRIMLHRTVPHLKDLPSNRVGRKQLLGLQSSTSVLDDGAVSQTQPLHEF